jgi:hypothetical protein
MPKNPNQPQSNKGVMKRVIFEVFFLVPTERGWKATYKWRRQEVVHKAGRLLGHAAFQSNSAMKSSMHRWKCRGPVSCHRRTSERFKSQWIYSQT